MRGIINARIEEFKPRMNMSNRFPAPCPVSKQIIGAKNWYGFSPFAFPGFVGTWYRGPSSGWGLTFSAIPDLDAPGGWTEGWQGGAPTPLPGDLVLSSYWGFTANTGSPDEFDAVVTYPQIYFVYVCILAGATASGRAVDPSVDTTHFTAWTGYGSVGTDGPTPWPLDDAYIRSDNHSGYATAAPGEFVGERELWLNGAATGTAYLALSIETDLDGFTGYIPSSAGPASYSWQYCPDGYFSAFWGSFTGVADGTFTYAWAVNQYNGAVTYTPNTNYAGADSFTFMVSNGLTNSVPATVTISVLSQADVAVFKTGPTSGFAGSNLTYTVTVTNSNLSNSSRGVQANSAI